MNQTHAKIALVSLVILVVGGIMLFQSGKLRLSLNASQAAQAISSSGTTAGGAVSIGVSPVSIPDGNFTSLLFSGIFWDSGNFGSISNGTFKFSKGGKYLLSAWTELEGNTPHAILPFQNGGGLLTHNTTGGDNTIILGLNVNAGDTISLSISQPSGTPKNLSSYNITITNIDPAGGGTGGGDSVTVASDPSKGIFFGTYSHIWSDGKGTLTVAGAGNGSQSSLHLQVPDTSKFSLPTDTLAELTLARTSNQNFGGNYGRWSFTTFGSGMGNVSGIYGEFGGTEKPTDFIFNYGYENPPGQFKSTEAMRLMSGLDLGNVGFGFTATSPRDVIQLIPAEIRPDEVVSGSVGIRDSHAILWRARNLTTSGISNDLDWRAFVRSTGQSFIGTSVQNNSVFTIENRNQNQNNGAPWTTRFSVNSNGYVGAAGLNIIHPNGNPVLLFSGKNPVGCIQVRDSDDAGWTYVRTLKGQLQASTVAC